MIVEAGHFALILACFLIHFIAFLLILYSRILY